MLMYIMDTQIKHRIEMAEMCCKLLSRHNTFTDEFRKTCTVQLRELLSELQNDLFKYDPDFKTFWDIMEVFTLARPYLEYRP